MKRVVITGMGAVTPIGNSVSAMWSAMRAGVCGIGPITKFDTADYKVKIAAELKDFDPSLVMEKSEVRKTDPFTRYALAAAAEAMAQSGLTVADPYRFGVYVGSGIGGMDTLLREHEALRVKGPRFVSPHFIPMMISNIAAGNVAIRFGAMGPCLPVVTACATSTHAIGEAYRAIKLGIADAILAGGTEATINTLAVAGFTNCMALTARNDPQSASIPFDRRRDGFVMGEGAGIMVLEEYGHAKARGAVILGEITGYANLCDAYHVTAPQPEALPAARAISMAMEEAGITPGHAGDLYINAHGTSTPLNDKTETLAIKRALGDAAFKAAISSTKSMTGHMLGAAGGVEAIAAAMALRDGVLPPTIGYGEPDPECDLDYVPNQARQAQKGFALSLSLGFGGHNAVLALKRFEEADR